MNRRLMRIGLVGSVLAALCCFTPLLPFVLGGLGLSGLLGYVYRDDVLLTALVFFLALTGVAYWRRKRTD